MELSQRTAGPHTTPCPSGLLIASIVGGKLKIHLPHAPERLTEISIRIPSKDVAALRWNTHSDRVAILSHRLIEIVDLHDDRHRVRLDNGSGGLGKFASADFIGDDELLVTWEFGKAKVWKLSNGKGVDLADIKTACSGDKWRLRPKTTNAATQTLASLSRSGTDDVLQLFLPTLQKPITSTKLLTADAQSLSWSPDGRWLAVLDTPTARTSVHFYTPDGCLFRSHPASRDSSQHGLGVKSICWSGDSQIVGLTRFDGQIVLLNTRTFTPLAVIEHHILIDQSAFAPAQAPIWQEAVSASSERSYTAVAQPFAPPLSRTKASTEPSELGVAEAAFSCDGAFLATRDERMLSTVWIWDAATLGAHAVVVQHSNVRKMQWHPNRPDTLLLDCGEGIAYLLNAAAPREPPTAFAASLPGSSALSWLASPENALPAVLCATKSTFQLLYPEGRPEPDVPAQNTDRRRTVEPDTLSEAADGEGDDSLLDMLAGRTPLPAQSYTERIDIEVETEEGDSTTRMEDTFRGKQVLGRRTTDDEEEDPFDDSQIF